METMTANGVQYEHTDTGGIRMLNAKTIDRYHELRNEQPDTDKYGVFFAFTEKDLIEGRQRLIDKGYMKEGEKVKRAGMGLYGTSEEIHRYLAFYDERAKKITEECNPQEVYFYECNNHECMLTHDDDQVVKIIAEYFGKEAAHKIVRHYGGTPTNILVPLTERDEHLQQHQHTMMMLERLAFDCHGFFNEHDCRYHRPDCLWAGCVKGQMSELRKLYHQLPDDIKDESPISREAIENYGVWFEAWANEEFSKAEYDPKPRTRREDLPEEIKLYDSLYYKDDDGHLQQPDHVWFSCDTRRWHQDERRGAGRAMTSYLGKNGTTLATVYVLGDRLVPYERKDLCDVSCKYERKFQQGYLARLYDFYYE